MLRSPSAGKLLQYLIDDAGHICAGETFAEIEVSVTDFGRNLFQRHVVVDCWSCSN